VEDWRKLISNPTSKFSYFVNSNESTITMAIMAMGDGGGGGEASLFSYFKN
jgi:hypothetical protein